ncbi:MAG: type I restriction-modification system subunit M [Clostridia bacterium]|nr:type I restriction-modification system subunit M [Clostridia bacterium]
MSNSRIDDKVLDAYLYESADLLRGTIPGAEYQNYIFPLLFLKRISDVYEEEYQKAVELFGDDDLLISRYKFSFSIPEKCRWKYLRNTTKDVGTKIIKMFETIQNENPVLIGVFGNQNWANKEKLPDYLLHDLVEHFSKLTLSLETCPEDELGNAYEILLKRFADDGGNTAQEFYTNRTVVKLMAEILDPKTNESIYDPTCGTAGMLISSIYHVKNQNKEWRNMKVYGQEITPLTASIAKTNLFLNGVKEFKIATGDTLEHPAFYENEKIKQFDVVLANPPYSISQWNRTAFEHDKYGRNFLGTPSQGNADYAFFQHILKSMDPNTGRCAILFPHGVLTRDEEDFMREKLVKEDLIDCIIGIGKNLFYNCPMEACIIICRSVKPNDRKGKILFIDAKNEVTRKNSYSFLEEKHIEKIKKAYNLFNNCDGFAYVADLDEIGQNKFKLGISRYVHKLYIEEDVSSNEAIGEWLFQSNRLNAETKAVIKKLEA